jgi:hypothetical protein
MVGLPGFGLSASKPVKVQRYFVQQEHGISQRTCSCLMKSVLKRCVPVPPAACAHIVLYFLSPPMFDFLINLQIASHVRERRTRLLMTSNSDFKTSQRAGLTIAEEEQ